MQNLPILLLMLLALSCDTYAQFERITAEEIKGLSKSEVETVTYCELVRNPKLYDRKFIRVGGVYAKMGGEYSNLFDLSCLSNQSKDEKVYAQLQTWVWFDENHRNQTNPNTLKVFERLVTHEHRASVLLVGKFYGSDKHGGYGHLNSAKFQIVVLRIEEVKSVPANAP